MLDKPLALDRSNVWEPLRHLAGMVADLRVTVANTRDMIVVSRQAIRDADATLQPRSASTQARRGVTNAG